MAKNRGLYNKFYVSRVDGRDAPGGDKENARYFILDFVNDKFAREALMYYAFKCAEEIPELSSDIWTTLLRKDS
jgi:hypothetical protein